MRLMFLEKGNLDTDRDIQGEYHVTTEEEIGVRWVQKPRNS